jgi:acetoin utilization deacetylase AcuC-like enzyme
VKESGTGEGRGFTINVPLSAGADDDVYAAAFSRLVAPLASEYAPGLVLLSAGFDAHRADPLAEMRLTAGGYGALMHALADALPPETPVGMVLEGGYDLDALETSLQAALEGLLLARPAPASASPRSDSTHALELDRALGAARAFWHL